MLEFTYLHRDTQRCKETTRGLHMAAAEKSCTKLGVQIQHELEVCFISTLKAGFVEALSIYWNTQTRHLVSRYISASSYRCVINIININWSYCSHDRWCKRLIVVDP